MLKSTFDATGSRDGRVSIEVDPRISADAERTAAEARGLWWLIDRPNLFIKIPATEAALPAITASIADGISVNVTLIFSIDRYRAVLDALMTGLELRLERGEDISKIESVASFFVSRVDLEVDRRLVNLQAASDEEFQSRRDGLHGKVAIANARLAYEVYEQSAASDRWTRLAQNGASLQRLLWASTGVKDEKLAATYYVTELVARDTVNTMPEATLKGVSRLDESISDTVTARYDDARTTIKNLADIGIDLDNIAATLEREGIASFEKSWNELIASVEMQLEHAGADVGADDGAVRPANARKKSAPAQVGLHSNFDDRLKPCCEPAE
jgi:transaldolase